MGFELTESVCVAFSRTKEEISKNVTLPYFNPRSATTLQTDASRKVLEQSFYRILNQSCSCQGLDWK